MTHPARPSGVTLGPLLVAAVLASPALWRALQQQMLPLYVALERLLIIAVLCVLVADVVRRYLDVVPQAAPDPVVEPRAGANPLGGRGASEASLETPEPFERSTSWDLGSDDLLDDDLFALDPLPGDEAALGAIGPE